MPRLHILRLVCSKHTCYRVYAILAFLTRLLIRLVAWVLEEFQPWVKWVIMDAALAYFVGVSAKKYLRLAHVYQAIGWM
ncbi:hypothetical protein ABBQ32_010543 [Trebouxia sp. C0010 RCD-2024]